MFRADLQRSAAGLWGASSMLALVRLSRKPDQNHHELCQGTARGTSCYPGPSPSCFGRAELCAIRETEAQSAPAGNPLEALTCKPSSRWLQSRKSVLDQDGAD